MKLCDTFLAKLSTRSASLDQSFWNVCYFKLRDSGLILLLLSGFGESSFVLLYFFILHLNNLLLLFYTMNWCKYQHGRNGTSPVGNPVVKYICVFVCIIFTIDNIHLYHYNEGIFVSTQIKVTCV